MDDIKAIWDELERLKKYLNDILLHLDSDNIVEIDFGRTRLRNGKGDREIAMKQWVIDNFQPK